MFDPTKKVLIVDDMSMIRRIVKQSLAEIDYKNVIEAKDGQEGWNLLNVHHDDISFIISDWNMPVLTGIEFLEKIRTSENVKQIPFIFLTAEADVSQIKQAIDRGADNYVLKPFSPASLKAKIEQTYTKVKGRIAA